MALGSLTGVLAIPFAIAAPSGFGLLSITHRRSTSTGLYGRFMGHLVPFGDTHLLISQHKSSVIGRVDVMQSNIALLSDMKMTAACNCMTLKVCN